MRRCIFKKNYYPFKDECFYMYDPTISKCISNTSLGQRLKIGCFVSEKQKDFHLVTKLVIF